MLLAPHLLTLALIAADTTPPPASTDWRLSLPEAIRISLHNSEVVRVVGLVMPGSDRTVPTAAVEPDRPGPTLASPAPEGFGLAIARVDGDTKPEPFRADLMAHVRSVVQQYQALAQGQVAVEALETALRSARSIRDGEQARPDGQRSDANLAEADALVQTLTDRLAGTRAEVETLDRQFRNLLGLPAHDGRRLITWLGAISTLPATDRVALLTELARNHPEVVARRRYGAELEAIALAFEADATVPAATREQARRMADNQHALVREAVVQVTRKLHRLDQDADATAKLARTARRLLTASRQRLDAQQVFYAQGRITLDGLTDAVTQLANATIQDAESRAANASALAALDEYRGTLLESRGIAVVPNSDRAKVAPASP